MKRWLFWLRWLTPPVLVLALYWPVLGMPFFWDDIPIFVFMGGHPPLEIWVTAAGYPYYRPFGFLLWQVVQTLFEANNTVVFHALNPLVLIVDGWLVGLLAVRLAGNVPRNDGAGRESGEVADLYGWLAGALLVVFPFAALAVPQITALFHLQLTLIGLVAALALLEYQRGGRWQWAVVAVAAGALTPFLHEAGAVIAGVLVAVWLFAPAGQRATSNAGGWQAWLGPERRRGLAIIVTVLVCNLIYLPVRQAIPKSRSDGGLPFDRFNLHEALLNGVFFFMGLTFPVQPLALPVMDAFDIGDVLAVVGLGGAALAAAAIVMVRAGYMRWLLAGVLYALAGALPSIIALPFQYVIVSPRLMLFGAPGVALLWAGAATALVWPLARRAPGVGLWLAVGLVVAALVVPVQHIIREVQLHGRALSPVWDMVRAAEQYPDERHLVINPTSWLALADTTYPLGTEGVVVIPEYSTPGQFVELHLGRPVVFDGVEFPLVHTEPERHYFDVWGQILDWEAMAAAVRQYDRVWLVRYGDEQLDFVEVGGLRREPLGGAVVASFDGGRIVLERASARVVGDHVQVMLDWHMSAASTEDVFSQVRDCAGNTLGQIDGAPLGGTFPIWLWQPGETVRDVRTIPIVAPTSDGCYQVIVGLFNPIDGTRPVATDASGQPIADSVIWLPVEASD